MVEEIVIDKEKGKKQANSQKAQKDYSQVIYTVKNDCISLVILDVACCYLWLFSLYINIKIGKNSC